MKREDILAMTADRELDALVAEKVMGWHRVDMTPKNNGWFWSDGNKHIDWDSFSPSTDISAAWGVVEKMRETHWFELRVGKEKESAGFEKYRSWHGTGEPTHFAQCDKAPESICKAALLTVLEESL